MVLLFSRSEQKKIGKIRMYRSIKTNDYRALFIGAKSLIIILFSRMICCFYTNILIIARMILLQADKVFTRLKDTSWQQY
jgi:hypothetical protein